MYVRNTASLARKLLYADLNSVRRVFRLCLCLKCFYRIKCDLHSAYKLTHLSISPSPAFFTCYHHLPHQPLQVYCTILCFNHSLNLLLGFTFSPGWLSALKPSFGKSHYGEVYRFNSLLITQGYIT